MKIQYAVFVLSVALALLFFIPETPAAAEAEDAMELEREDEWEGERGEEEDEAEEEEENAPLGRTLRLVFHLPDGGDRPPMFLLCATRVFAYRVEFGNDRNHHRFAIHGSLEPVDEGGEYLLRYEVELESGGEAHHASMAAEGSVILPFGPPRPVVLLGERELLVGLHPEGEGPPPPPGKEPPGEEPAEEAF
jgi:hypothetical protein